MPPESDDAAYLWDMLNAARETRALLTAVNREAFLDNLTLRRAAERTLEILGEAARRVSAEFRAAHPEVPWRDIVGQRNILAHDYGQVDHEVLYQTVRDDIPALIATLEKLLPEQ